MSSSKPKRKMPSAKRALMLICEDWARTCNNPNGGCLWVGYNYCPLGSKKCQDVRALDWYQHYLYRSKETSL